MQKYDIFIFVLLYREIAMKDKLFSKLEKLM